MHTLENVAAFETATDALRLALGNVVDHADALLPLAATARQRLAECDVTVAKLRRGADEPEDMGTLNSLTAVQVRHKALAAGIEAMNQHALHLLDLEREFRLLHPRAVAALAERTAKTEGQS